MDKIELKSERWDEGAPIGNGKIGSIVYGGNPLKITVDRADLWDLRPNETTLEKGFNYANLVKLSADGNEDEWRERARLFEDIFMGKPESSYHLRRRRKTSDTFSTLKPPRSVFMTETTS